MKTQTPPILSPSLPPSPPVSLPPIRTMRDDLLGIQKGGMREGQSTSSPVGAKNIALPNAQKTVRRAHGVRVLLISSVVLVLCGGGAFFGMRYWTMRQAQGIVRDIPSEAVAFFVLPQSASSFRTHVLPVLVAPFGISVSDLGTTWSELAYVLLPGGSPSAPVPMLVLRTTGGPLSVSGQTVAQRTLRSGATALVRTADGGRLDALSGTGITSDPSFLGLQSSLGSSSMAPLLYIREGLSTSLLAPFTFLPQSRRDGILFSFFPSETTPSSSVRFVAARSGSEESVSTAPAWAPLLERVPATSISATAGISFANDIETWKNAQSNNPNLTDFFKTLAQATGSLETVKSAFAGPYIAGTLPTTIKGVRDGFLVASLKPTATAAAEHGMQELEPAFSLLGTFFTGTVVPPPSFSALPISQGTLHFANFGTTSRSFDYLVTDGFLFLATSKESMTTLLQTASATGSASSLARDPDFAKLPGTSQAGRWSILRTDPSILEEVPAVWQPFLQSLKEAFFSVATQKTLGGAVLFADTLPSPSVSPLPSPPASSLPVPSPTP